MKKSIGILGGMGPQASVELYRILIEKSTQYGAVRNDEFPSIVLDSVPVPDFISSSTHLVAARIMLLDRIKRLNVYGVGHIGLACNTAHILLEDLRSASKAPIVSIMEEAKKIAMRRKIRRVGLLASPMTYKMKVYQSHLEPEVIVVVPSKKLQQTLDDVVRGIIRGQDRGELEEQANLAVLPFIREQKLEAIILGCTELPLVFRSNLSISILSSLDILADALLQHYYGRRRGGGI